MEEAGFIGGPWQQIGMPPFGPRKVVALARRLMSSLDWRIVCH